MVQPDLKKLVAYSSVSHLGFVVLGLFALNSQGVQGGVIQMINHGLSTGALFLLVGMIYERRHTRMIADFGGLAKCMPIFATIFLIVTLSSIGLPGLNGFVGEFMILLGSFISGAFSKSVRRTCRNGGHSGGGLYALDVSTRDVWKSWINRKIKALKDLNLEGSYRATSHTAVYRVDWRISQAVPQSDREIRQSRSLKQHTPRQ